MRPLLSMIAAAGMAMALAAPGQAQKSIQVSSRTTITVATYNVCKVNCKGGRFAWDRRRRSVVRNVSAAGPAVLAVQEAPTLPWRGTTQWADITRLLARKGYRQTSDEDGCTQGCTRGSHLYFDPARVRVFRITKPSGQPVPPAQCMKYLNDPNLPDRKRGSSFDDWYRYRCVDHVGYRATIDMATGMMSQRQLSGLDWGNIQDRNVSWAYLQDIATGAVFMALSVHLPNEKTAQGETVRRRTAARIASWAESQNAGLGLGNIPVVLMGDLNSFQARQPVGAQAALYAAGFVDAFSAKVRINAHYPTVNVTPLTRRWDGFPPRPFRYAGPANRIDYILAKNGVRARSYEVFLTLRRGRFDNRYRGSDHNLVRADLWIPVVVPQF